MEIWDKLDEVIGAGILGSLGAYSLHLGSPEVCGACVTGIIALLSIKAAAKHNEGKTK